MSKEIEKLKELYASGDYVVYIKMNSNIDKYIKITINPSFNEKVTDYKLIHKKDETIADAVVENPHVEIEMIHGNGSIEPIACFFSEYRDFKTYRLKEPKQDFNGGYIEASQEAYDLLIKAGYSMYRIKGMLAHHDVIIIYSDGGVWMINSKKDAENNPSYKQFYINKGKLSWEKPKKTGFEESIKAMTDFVSATYGIKTKGKEENAPTCENCGEYGVHTDEPHTCRIEYNITSEKEMKIIEPQDKDVADIDVGDIAETTSEAETISIKDEQGEEYKFEKPKFECELFKMVGTSIFGWCRQISNPKVTYAVEWDMWGKCKWIKSAKTKDYNLKPIKPNWHEDESNFPALITLKENNYKFELCVSLEHWVNFRHYYRLATKQEVDSLYYQGKQKI